MAQVSKPVFNWASVAKGKPQTIANVEAEKAALKEKERLANEEKQRLAWEADAPRRAYLETMRNSTTKKEQENKEKRAIYQAEHDRKFSKEGGWLSGQWTTSHEVPYGVRLTVPLTVNERARDWVERALASWWQEWEKCETVGALRIAFINAFVPFALEHGNYRRVSDFEYWEKRACLVPYTCHVERYANMLKWVEYMESDKANPPYGNPFWVACKNITFENCLWAMNVEARTFRALDKLCPDSDVPITGFLQVEGQVLTWLADFTKYIPYKHDPKPKSQKAIEAKRKRDEEDLNRMLDLDYD
jgi:hypothetical protein